MYCEFDFLLWRGVLDTTLCDNVCQWLAASQWFTLGTPVSSTNKTDLHDIHIVESDVKHHNYNSNTVYVLCMYYVCIMLIMYVAHQGCVVTIIRDQTTELLIMYVAHQGCVVTIIRDQTTELLIMYVAHQWCVVTIIRDQTTELLIMYVAHQWCQWTIVCDMV